MFVRVGVLVYGRSINKGGYDEGTNSSSKERDKFVDGAGAAAGTGGGVCRAGGDV